MKLFLPFLAAATAASPSTIAFKGDGLMTAESDVLNLKCKSGSSNLCALSSDVENLKTAVANINTDLNKLKDKVEGLTESEIKRSKCPNPYVNLIKNGEFIGSSHWENDSRNWGSSSGSYYPGGNHAGGFHIHNSCQINYGGIKQTVSGLTPGATYTLRYSGWGGNWDGDDNDHGRGVFDVDSLTVVIDGNQWIDSDMGHTTSGALQGISYGVAFEHSFVAKSAETELVFWAARSNCFDIDHVQLSCGGEAVKKQDKCPSPGRNLVFNGDFNGRAGWDNDSNNYGSSGSYYPGDNHAGGFHIHNSCQINYGGIKQAFPNLVEGVTYTLAYHGWGGNWDGDDNDHSRGRIDTDKLLVHIDGKSFTDSEVGTSTAGASAGLGQGQEFTHTFVASGRKDTTLSLWAARSNCFDVDNVRLYC